MAISPQEAQKHMEEKDKEIEDRFSYHPPDRGQIRKYECLRETAMNLANVVLEFVPKSREQSLALTKIEEAVMWANAGIARRT